MSRFSSSEGSLGKYPTLVLHDSSSNTKVEIALRGAHVLSYFVPVDGRLYNIIDGYASEEELELQRGARSCIMAPFSNRIENGEYEWEGKNYKIFSPIPSRKEVIHGFARVLDFKLINVTTSNQKAEVTLFSDYIRPGVFEGYPFSVDIVVKYTLMSKRFLVDVIMKNAGNENAPCGCGWHPYFKSCDSGVDHLVLKIPAENIVKVNENHVPLRNDEAFSHLNENPEADFRPGNDDSKNVIGSRKVNYCYTGMQTDKDGLIRSSIYDPRHKIKISVFQKGGVFYAYTADEVQHRPRMSIALEPVQFITNAFNRPELKDQILVKPGSSASFSFGVEVEE